MIKRLMRWLKYSEHVHIRQRGPTDAVSLLALLDRFLDDTFEYLLEWDDFISWDHPHPQIEAIRDRIADLEMGFRSKVPIELAAAYAAFYAERNAIAERLGLPARENTDVTCGVTITGMPDP